MKKLLKSLLLVLPLIAVTSCDNTSEIISSISDSNSVSDSSSIADIVTPLFISEFVCGSSSSNRAIEIGNNSDKQVDLNGFQLNYYKTNSTTPNYTYYFNGSVPAYSTYVIVDKTCSDENLILKANAIDDVQSIGTWPIELAYHTQRIDTLGFIGYNVDYGSKTTLVRKTNKFNCDGNYSAYNYIAYNADNFSYLGNLDNSLSETELFSGPHLSEENFALPYADKSTNLGTGGVAEVNVKSYGDGDTTSFYYPSEINNLGFYDGTGYRYQNINTPKIQHGTEIDAQPWGVAAKTWNNNILKNAKSILVQSIKGGTLTETYDRLLGFVWVSNVSSPKPEDYINLNFLTVQNGFSEVHFSDVASGTMLYKDLSYYAYMIDAQNYAKMLGLKIHGETDPNFDY